MVIDMKFAFIIMGNFDYKKDYAHISDNTAQIIGCSNIEEACIVAKKLHKEGVHCIELCGAFGINGARKIIEITNNSIPIGFVTHLPEQDSLYTAKFGKN